MLCHDPNIYLQTGPRMRKSTVKDVEPGSANLIDEPDSFNLVASAASSRRYIVKLQDDMKIAYKALQFN